MSFESSGRPKVLTPILRKEGMHPMREQNLFTKCNMKWPTLKPEPGQAQGNKGGTESGQSEKTYRKIGEEGMEKEGQGKASLPLK